MAAAIGIAAIPLALQALPKKVDRFFTEERINRFAHCFIEATDADVHLCKIDREHIDWQLPEEGMPTFLMYAVANEQKVNLTPVKLAYLIESGAEPEKVLGYVLTISDFALFSQYVRSSGGPNAFGGRMLHDAAVFWREDRMALLVEELGGDLEIRDPLSEETVVLTAKRSQHSDGPLAAINWLLDRGADPTAMDDRGRDLCEFVSRGPDVRRGITEEDLASLSERLGC
ncbi:hypothetical protein M3P36_14630 [Altererythrobacter sp. KTW20L]|nr:hypothetical protein [Altererythrobacter sp. KTW20L]